MVPPKIIRFSQYVKADQLTMAEYYMDNFINDIMQAKQKRMGKNLKLISYNLHSHVQDVKGVYEYRITCKEL